jgi:two-component system, NtrC family, response regulator GlrR
MRRLETPSSGVKMMKQPNILLLDCGQTDGLGEDLKALLSTFAPGGKLRRQPFDCAEKSNAEPLKAVRDFRPDVIFLILSAEALKQFSALLPALRREAPEVPLMIALAAGDHEELLALLDLGVSDFITPPLRAFDIFPRVQRLLSRPVAAQSLTRTLKESLGLRQLVGESAAFQAQVRKIPLVAKCDASILITGETGTGKEVCARAIHYLSPRAHKPFVPVNCGAIPADLVENELFGHDRGAYTGAASAEPGLIQEADEGTLFFDEIDCLPLLAQVKLLRFLQEKEYRPLGSSKVRKADVRVVAATNSDLEKAVRDGRLRQDLYYRLNIIPLNLPPLRDRQDDILLLARHFLTRYAAEFNKQVTGFAAEAVQSLLFYQWPGNVRELEHVVQRAVVLCEQALIHGHDIVVPNWGESTLQEPFCQVKTRIVAQFEKTYIQQLLQSCRGNITEAARVAQKNRRAFWQLIRKHRIDVQAFKNSA